MQLEILIKQIRKSKGISLERLAKISGISRTHINDIENNKKNPSLYAMILLAKSLHVDIQDTFKIKRL